MDQQRATNALAPFLALAKSANSPRAAADLITQATSAPNTYVFAELLQQPNVQALAGHEQYGIFHKQLQMFAWGTWEEYKAAQDLPPLSDSQQLKLRLLSLLTIASSKHASSTAQVEHHLTYISLCAHLDLASSIDLEHLVTQAIYSNLITATLNPANQTVVITSVAALRDLAPGSLKVMMEELAAWSGRCDTVLADLEAEIAKVKAEAVKRHTGEVKTEKQIKVAVGDEGSKAPGTISGSAAGGKPTTRGTGKRGDHDEEDEDAMEVDGGGLGAGGGKKRGSGMLGSVMGRLNRR